MKKSKINIRLTDKQLEDKINKFNQFIKNQREKDSVDKLVKVSLYLNESTIQFFKKQNLPYTSAIREVLDKYVKGNI